MHVVTCTHDRHARPIVDIFNEAILNSTALYDYTPRPLESMTEWFRQKEAARYPVIGLEDDDGTLLGFASYGQFRVRPAYKYTVEHSIYTAPEARRRGVASGLIAALTERARELGKHMIIGGIASENEASLALHRKLGFSETGRLPEVGFKFGRWLDLVLMQRFL